MGTVQGVGTRFYSWLHHDDGTAHATLWFAVFFLPLLPLKRFHLRVRTDFKAREPFLVVPKKGFFAGVPTGLQVDHYELLEQMPLSAGEIIRTLALTYVLGPILVAWPVGLFFLLKTALDHHPAWRQSNVVIYAVVALMMIGFGNAIAVPLIALRRTRGFRGGLFE